MAGILEYLEAELRSFSEKPLGAVDSAALSQFCMVDGAGVVPGYREPAAALPGFLDTLADRASAAFARSARFADLLRAERFPHMFTGLDPMRVKRELAALAASPRFRDLELRDYASVLDADRHVQFAAVTFVCPGRFAYVGFRGTDVSFAGWRENFEMVYSKVPAQEMAASYLASVARHLPGRLYVGGHSKGGNLALFAALRAEGDIQRRIERVWCHDSPGFKRGLFSSADYAALEGRIDKTVPQDSVVGMLMEYLGDTRVVRSSAKGLDEHSVFTWDVEDGDFAYLDDVSDSAAFVRDVVAEWLAGFTDDEAKVVVDAIFSALEASGAEDAGAIFGGGRRALALLAEAAKRADEKSKDVLGRALSQLAVVAARRAGQGVVESLPFLR